MGHYRITADQCRAARALLKLSQADLAKESGISERAIAAFENKRRSTRPATHYAIRGTFERLGVVFTLNGVELSGPRL